ncbi:response regulator [Thermodesulfobacteriota bacterium]
MIFLRTLLDTGGFQSIGAENGAEGLKMAREETPALIILDIMMPQEGGVQMFCKLKQDETLKNIPAMPPPTTSISGCTSTLRVVSPR